MKYTLTLLLTLFLTFTVSCQTENPADFNFDFEKISDNAKLPDKWMQWGSGYDLKIDNAEKKSGKASLSLEPGAEKTENSFGAAAYTFPASYAGKEIELRGFLKLEGRDGGWTVSSHRRRKRRAAV